MAGRGASRSTGASRLFLARSLTQSGLLATIVIVVCVLTGLLAGLFGFLASSRTTSARAALATAAATESGYRFEVAASDDLDGQLATVDRLFSRSLAGIPVEITSLYRSAPVGASSRGIPLADRQGAPARLIVAAGSDLAGHARLVSGRWASPSTAGSRPETEEPEAAIHHSAMLALGLRLGEVVALGGARGQVDVRVVGSWLPEEGDDAFWFSDVLLLTGSGYPTADGARAFGPLVVAAIPRGNALADALEGTIQWTVLPDEDRIEAGDLAALVEAAGSLRRSLADDPSASNGRVGVAGNLAETLARFVRGQNATQGITPIGIILVALIGTVALAQMSRLLAVARRPDTALLTSRGARRARLIGHALVEAAIACGLGAAAGAALAQSLLVSRHGTSPPGDSVILLAVGTAAASVIVVVGTGVADLLRNPASSAADRAQLSGIARSRTRRLAAGGVALALGTAGLAIGQSLVYGSPIVVDAAGRQSVDPLIVLAPALGLVATCLVLLVSATPLSRWVEVLTARGRLLQPSLSARQLARGLGRSSAAVLVIALAVGALTVASAYSGTRSALDENSGLLRVGADERLVFREGHPALAGTQPLLAEPYRSLPGTVEAAPVLVVGVRLPDDLEGVLTAIDASRLPRVMSDVGGAVDTRGAAAALPAGPAFGLEVPANTSVITLKGVLGAQAPDRGGSVASSAEVLGTVWLESQDGSLLASSFGPLELGSGARSPVALETALPAGTTGWRIVAVDLEASASQYWTVDLEVTGFDAEDHEGAVRGLPFSGGDWTSQLALGSDGRAEPASTFRSDARSFGIGLSLRYGNHDGARAMAVSEAAPLAGRSDFSGTVNPLPVALSRSLADALYLDPGDTIDLRIAGASREVTATVTDILRHVPGTPSSFAVLVDLPSLNEHLLRTSVFLPTANELWIDAAGAPVDVAAIAGPGVRVSTAAGSTIAAITAAAETSLWLSAIGCLLFAALSLGAVALTIRRARRVDVVALRAEGLSAPAQARARFAETLAISATAIVFGLSGGMLVSALTVPNLARSVVLEAPADLAVPLQPALPPGLALLGLLVLALAAIAAVDAMVVRRQAAAPGTRWES